MTGPIPLANIKSFARMYLYTLARSPWVDDVSPASSPQWEKDYEGTYAMVRVAGDLFVFRFFRSDRFPASELQVLVQPSESSKDIDVQELVLASLDGQYYPYRPGGGKMFGIVQKQVTDLEDELSELFDYKEVAEEYR